MCAICEKAKKLPLTEAIEVIAQGLRQRRSECLDQTLGELLQMPEPQKDAEADADWEARKDADESSY